MKVQFDLYFIALLLYFEMATGTAHKSLNGKRLPLSPQGSSSDIPHSLQEAAPSI